MFVTPSTLIMTSLLLQAFFPSSTFLHFSFSFFLSPLSFFLSLSLYVTSCCSYCLIIFLNFLLLWIFIGHKPGIQIIYLITFITVFLLSIHFFSSLFPFTSSLPCFHSLLLFLRFFSLLSVQLFCNQENLVCADDEMLYPCLCLLFSSLPFGH